MGFFFSNLHIHKTEGVSLETILPLMTELMEKRGFHLITNHEEADLTISLLDNEGKWLSICSDGLEFYTDEIMQELCCPLSQRLSTDVMTISCFDSDCLLLNLLNANLGVNAWAKTGRYPGIKKRSTPEKWKEIVDDVYQFKTILKKEYTFSEEALAEIEPLLGLAPEQGSFCTELLADNTSSGTIRTLSFTLPETADKPAPPRLTIPRYSLMPCEIGEASIISAVNTGGKSTGLAIAFSGNYVENEEIWFRDVQLEYAFDRHPRPMIKLQLEKRQTQNGQWIYYAEVPQFQLMPGVKEGLPIRRAMEEEFKREFGLRFTPEGNERKRLDITLHFIPLKNISGQCGWCVWAHSGSKKAYIEQHNRTWSAHQPHGAKLIDIDTLDIDE
jgi:hypothetical protein